MLTTRKNATTKALQSFLAKEKKHSFQAELEWEIACNTNYKRGHVYDQHELLRLYSRDYDNWDSANEHGASKTCHLRDHFGNKFLTIVVKRHQRFGYIPDACYEHEKCTGNQLIDEINCWLEFAETETADLLCPILKYFTSKSDKVTATSETMLNNVIIIAQQAIKTGDAKTVCKHAEYLNDLHGYEGEGWEERYEKLSKLSNRQGWRDAMDNIGNSGVIFDYHKKCYKAVFIDYAL